ncbi:MAG: peptidoglycan bridge formation glycyltransferase FemA/FemB family protein [Chloroflexi bacterium]|nr:peptidoglycan bridge formation glycyltransferase FemA/FemB family protein [Chloroflexota bacterium]
MTTTLWNRVDDAAAWDQTILMLPEPHVLQSFLWGEFKSRWGWTTSRFVMRRDGKPVAAAQILRRPIGRSGWAVGYVPKGPLTDHDNPALFAETLAAIEQTARRQRCIFVKIDPDVPVAHQAAVTTLKRRGWFPSDEQIQFRNTALLDILPSEEEQLAGMKAKTRYNIRLARRRGVVVRQAGIEDLPIFYALYAETAARDDFLIRTFDYYRDVWATFLQAGRADFLLAYHEDQPLAGVLCFRFGTRVWYMYGASSGAGRRHMPNYLLQWEAICRARENGCVTYDLWGAPDVLSEEDPLWGVWRFKVGLGARFAPHIGAWDFVTSRPLYWAYQRARPRLLAWLRRRHVSASPTA